MRIAVLGYIVRGPLGGLAWHHLQYVMGLARLGHEVCFFEDSDEYESCFDPAQGIMTTDPSFGLAFTRDLFAMAGLPDAWAYFDAHRNAWLGPARDNACDFFRSADLVLNLSGVNPVREWTLHAPHRALIDTDPAFTQIRHLTDEAAMRTARAHTAFFTFGENFGKPGSSIPDDGLPWQPTRQPIVLDAWPVTEGNPQANFSTVMQWDSYRVREHDGRQFGMKSASFESYMDLPKRTDERLELALGSASAPRERLHQDSWIVSDPLAITRTALSYQRFIRDSKAEFSIAKHGYWSCRSGWFSERSAAYLASGRPVVTQETGFSDWLRSDGGVLAFDSPETAVEAIESVARDYARHCRLARQIAEEYFASKMVLAKLLACAV